MANSFGIPIEVEKRIRLRDKVCVYCHKKMIKPGAAGWRGDWATIEHFREEGPFYWKTGLKEEDLAICCFSCNASRGKKKLLKWFKETYCLENNVNMDTVAEPVRKFLVSGSDII